MNWLLFFISTALWIFFGVHFTWVRRLATLEAHEIHISSSVLSASKGLVMITMLNLIAFLLVYGFKVSWLSALAIVLGGYAAALAFIFIFRIRNGKLLHQIGWIAMPALSVIIWFAAF